MVRIGRNIARRLAIVLLKLAGYHEDGYARFRTPIDF